MSQRMVFIGAGNLATRLSLEFRRKGYLIEQVYSRTETSASVLGRLLQTNYTSSTDDIIKEADIYFIALKDSAIDEVLPQIDFDNRLVVHCSGSMPIDVLSAHSENYGVFYPLQTFSKERDVDFRQIPVFVEGNSAEAEKYLLHLADEISEKTSVMESASRIYLHVAAVFACNFVNHFYTVSTEVLKLKDIHFDVLHPLISETTAKATDMLPDKVQTGPAVRYDGNVISKHLELLESFPHYRELYKLISESVHHYHKNIDL